MKISIKKLETDKWIIRRSGGIYPDLFAPNWEIAWNIAWELARWHRAEFRKEIS